MTTPKSFQLGAFAIAAAFSLGANLAHAAPDMSSSAGTEAAAPAKHPAKKAHAKPAKRHGKHSAKPAPEAKPAS